MKKLKNKVFIIVFLIPTLFLINILIVFNYQAYKKEKDAITETLVKTASIYESKGNIIKKMYEYKENEMIYLDKIVYTIILEKDNNMSYIISHTDSNINTDTIISYANEILKKENNLNDNIKVNTGNLYFSDYSYSIKNENYIIIIYNLNTKSRLISLLQITLIIAAMVEIVIILVSIKLTNWVTAPVFSTFNKQKQFIEDAAHELKTPLAVIMANAENLEMDSKNDKWIYNIKSESERMNNLIVKLLGLAKLENKKEEVYSDINLSKTVEMSILTFESLIFERNIDFEYNIQENINFQCNADDIKELISILIDNAIEHSFEKDGKILVELYKEKNNIILEVKNKGNPISKDDEKRIFERFYRKDEARDRTDNHYGLGLAIAKTIVTNYEGNITAFSNNGYTTFKVVFKK